MTTFNNQAVLFFLTVTATRLSAVHGGGAGAGFNPLPATCEGFPCGPGFVCQMVEPPSCPYDSCAIPQCRPPTSCDDVECQPGFVCEVDSPPGNCPHCQPRAFCKPENQGICDAGEAYDYQKGKCVPYTCEATNVRDILYHSKKSRSKAVLVSLVFGNNCSLHKHYLSLIVSLYLFFHITRLVLLIQRACPPIQALLTVNTNMPPLEFLANFLLVV